MRENPFFSIQIAAYNAEKYISQCLDSILNQSEQDFEIILVDDCSTDNTGKICDEYAKKYQGKVVSVHNEENLGLLLTRRVAYKIARGKWILSVDADDLLPDGALSELKHAIETHDCDLILYNLTCIKQDGLQEEFKLDLEAGKVYQGDEKKQVYLQRYKNDHLNSMCTKAIRRDILDLDADYTPFRSLYLGEDIFQSYPILTNAKKILYLNKSLYLYIKREGSITNSVSKNWYDAKKILWTRDDEYLDKWGMGASLRGQTYLSRIRAVVGFVDVMYYNHFSDNEIQDILDKICGDGLLLEWYNYIGKAKIKWRHRKYCELIFNNGYNRLRILSYLGRKISKIIRR